MSDSDAATLNADQNSVGGVQKNEQLREKWKRVKVKKEEVNRDLQQEKKLSDKVLSHQNGLSGTGSQRGVKCPVRVIKGHSDVDLGVTVKSGHPDLVIQPQKTVKLQSQKVVKQRTHSYTCLSCKGKSFASKLSLHRHLLLHIALPEVKLNRIVKEEEDCEDLDVIYSDRPQVARKRVTLSSHARSPLKFRLMCTNVNDGKDSFKLVKSSVTEGEKPDSSNSLEKNTENRPDSLPDDASVNEKEVSDCESKENVLESVIPEAAKETPIEDSSKEEKGEHEAEHSQTTKSEVEVSGEQLSAPLEEQCRPDSSENSKDPPSTPLKAKESPTKASKAAEKQGIDERTMRQMKNVESEMEKMQSKSPSVIQNSHEPRQIANDKNGLNSLSEAELESLQPEFIPIERLEKDGPPPLISTKVNKMVQPAVVPHENVSETHILCEACGETVIGDQTALEDHCLCRGHYKCPICSVACASTDALAIHSKESHPNADLSAHLIERKKKSSLRAARQKHADLADKDASRDSLSDLSNSPSIPSPSADIRTPPLPSPTGVRVSESVQNVSQNKRTDVLSSSRVHEQDGRRNSPSTASGAIPSETGQAANNYPSRGSSQQNPQVRLPPGRVSDTMPPPLMRPLNARSNDSQPRTSMANAPMQAPPALYKVPTSHGMSNTQPTTALPTIPGTAYIRGIPASGYQPDLQAAAAANPFAPSASNHLAASAAALNARYQSMHHGYPPGSQPQPGYAAYPQPMQTQQRYQMAPPPPYPNHVPPHLQQNPRAALIPQNAYGLASSQQAYNQSLLKAQLEQARMQLPQPSTMLQTMQNLQQEHYQQTQLQQQLFQQPHPQAMQPAPQEQIRAPVPPQPQNTQKRKGSSNNSSQLRYHHQTALQNQQQLQNQLQQSGVPPPAKQRRQHRDNIGIPSKQTDSDCEIIAVQQRGEGVPVIQSIQGANASSSGDNGISGSDSSTSSNSVSVPTTSESTIHLTDSITLSVRQPPGSSSSSGSKGHSANAVASILATRGITVTPASGATPSRSSGGQRARPSPPLNHGQASSSPSQSAPMTINSAISISHSSRPPPQGNDGFAVPAPVAPSRQAQRQPPQADRPPRPPTVDLTDENAHALAANSIVSCRLCDKQFPSHEALQQHMHVIHQTRNYFRCSICNAKHPSQQALSNHIKRVHKFGSTSSNPPELVIPLVDLKNTGAMGRLSSLGVNYVISLSQLGMSSDNSTFCIPIMSLDASGQARNNSISGLMSMGTAAVLPIGPVKSLPTAPPHSQQPQTQPQTVPSLGQGNASLPPGTSLRGPVHQYVQPSTQGAPR